MVKSQDDRFWQVRVVGSRLPWRKDPVRPAEVNEGLLAAMVDRANLLEDVRYQKIVPNHYIVELSADNYGRNYRPIENQILQQWKDSLIERLMLANSRQGRKEYQFAGRLKLSIRTSDDLQDSQARILCQVLPDDFSNHGVGDDFACLKWVGGERIWKLQPDITTIGRDFHCDIYLDMPDVHDRRLVSGLHAYLQHRSGVFYIFDGEPGGKPSLNGTYVNGQRVPLSGCKLNDGDLIILASLDPSNPIVDTPGVASFHFQDSCE